MSAPRPTVFLDRDGTINEDVGYLNTFDRLTYIPGALDAIRLLARADYQIVIVTNQAGLALGFFDDAFLSSLHQRIEQDIRAAGGRVEGWFVCPHHVTAKIDRLRLDCDCRKPRPGLFTQACAALPVDVSRSLYVGDKTSDMQAAEAAGLAGILVRTGYGEGELARHGGRVPGATAVASDLMGAASAILRGELERRG